MLTLMAEAMLILTRTSLLLKRKEGSIEHALVSGSECNEFFVIFTCA